ncbi:MAG TPA: hypothetical protein VK841_01115 [Polyangiaceae bacterium]|jgi:hypothetical protein|nr:hypothetical protein [Polyangiaceae bacterium]
MTFPRSKGRDMRAQQERHDELSDGVPSAEQAEASQERKAGGNGIQKGAKAVPRLGGKSRKGRTRLTHEIALGPVAPTLQRRARFMRKRTCSELAATVGGGRCGIIASALVKLASEDMAMREAALTAGEVDLARKLGESARGHLVYSREICAKDAAVRPAANANATPWLEASDDKDGPK